MHDQLWKEGLGFFVPEFLTLLFPDVAADLYLSKVRTLNKELFTHAPEGNRREPDILIEVPNKRGRELTIVHMEIQANRSRGFPRRMWEYYLTLSHRFRHPILPIALYLCRGGGGMTEEEHVVKVHGRVVVLFRYMAVYLPDLWEEDFQDDVNVLSPAVCAAMRSRDRTNVERKIWAYELIAKASVGDEERSVLLNMVDQYLVLNESEKADWNEWVEQRKSQEVRQMLTQWHRKGMEEGRDEGREEGRVEGREEGKRETLLRQMKRKFGEPSESVKSIISNIRNPDTLDELMDRLFDANSLEEMRLEEI